MQDEKNFYCDKVSANVKIQFDYDKMNSGLYMTERSLNNQTFYCVRLASPDYCKLCTPMTKFDIWEKLIKNFNSLM